MAQDSNRARPASGSRRRRMMLATVGTVAVGAAAAIVLGVIIGLAVVDDGDDGDDPATVDDSATMDGTPPSQTEALDTPPDGGELRLAESGLSVYEVEGLPDTLSYGVMLENTSDDHVAEFSTVSVEVTDADGEVIAAGDDVEQQHEVTVVMPGEQVGVGSGFNVDKADLDPSGIELDVDIGDARWWAVEDSDYTAIHAAAVSVGDVDNGWVELTFEVTSEYSLTLDDTRTYAIFRDGDGAIVGAAPPMDGQPLPPGTSEGRHEVRDSLPQAADETRTEVYVLPH